MLTNFALKANISQIISNVFMQDIFLYLENASSSKQVTDNFGVTSVNLYGLFTLECNLNTCNIEEKCYILWCARITLH